MIKNILIIGTGAYGTAMAERLMPNSNNNILLYGISKEEVAEINNSKTNSKYFNSLKLNSNFKATTNLEEALKNIDVVFLATPSNWIIDVIEKMIKILDKPIIWINLAKGFDYENNEIISKVMIDIIPEELNNGVCKIAGPSFAIEMIEKTPVAFTIGCTTLSVSKEVKEIYRVPGVITEITDDIIGVEFSSVIKNSLAIFLGVVSGLNMQTNGMAMFMVMAIKEMQQFKKAYPSLKKETLLGFSGLGDLILTGTSMKSRNFQVGYQIGSQNKVDIKEWEETTIEGIRSIEVLLKIAEKNEIILLLLPTLKEIMENKENPKLLVNNLIEKLNKLDLIN